MAAVSRASSTPSSRKSASSVADVTVVLALYNGGDLTRLALESVVAQSLAPREIVIVNDGSTDDSKNLVTRFARAYRGPVKITIVNKENGGQGSARNLGASLAKTEFLAFIDQDDTWPADHIEVLLESFENRPDRGWAYSDFCQIDLDGKMVRRGYLTGTGYTAPASSMFAMLAQDLMMLPSATLMRTRAFADAGGFDTRFRGYEDDDLFLRIFYAGWSFRFEPRPVTNYRIHADNSSRQSTFLHSRQRFFYKYQNEFFPPGSENYMDFRVAITGRMTRSFLLDAIALRGPHVPADYKVELRKVAKDILSNLGWTMKRRVIMIVVRNPYLVPLLIEIWGRVNKNSRANRGRVF
jgi:GT2 family glycosyltransferase